MLRQINLKHIGLGTAVIAGLFALNSCVAKPPVKETPSNEEIENIQRACKAHNDEILAGFNNVVQADSIDMINAQKAIKNINMSKLEKDYEKASAAREKARTQLATAAEDGKEDIIADRKEKLNEVITRTQAAVDAYNNALHTRRMANGEFYNDIKNKYNTLKEFSSSPDYLNYQIHVTRDLNAAYAVSPNGEYPLYY